MVSAKNVQSLNDSIEKIHTDKTKAETRQELLNKQLTSELSAYKVQFGVDLTGKDLKATKALIDAEIKKVTSAVEEEYNLKLAVVRAIEAGDYDEAYKLLGIERETGVEDVDEDTAPDLSENISLEEPTLSTVTTEEGTDTSEEDFDFGNFTVEEEEEEVKAPEEPKNPSKTDTDLGGFGNLEVVEDEDDELSEAFSADIDFGFGSQLKGTKFE